MNRFGKHEQIVRSLERRIVDRRRDALVTHQCRKLDVLIERRVAGVAHRFAHHVDKRSESLGAEIAFGRGVGKAHGEVGAGGGVRQFAHLRHQPENQRGAIGVRRQAPHRAHGLLDLGGGEPQQLDATGALAVRVLSDLTDNTPLKSHLAKRSLCFSKRCR